MKPLKRNGVYYSVWTCVHGQCLTHREPARHWASLRTGDKREAIRLCNELNDKLEMDRARRALGLGSAHRVSMTLGAFADKYIESTAKDKAPLTHRTEKSHLKMLIAYFGETFDLANLAHDVLETYKRHRLTIVAPRSWNSELAALKSVFNWGLRCVPPLYGTSPFANISRVDKGVPTVNKYVERDDLKKVVQACNDPFWKNVLAFLYATWCRGSELVNLKWSDVNYRTKTIEFQHPKERRKKTIPLTPLLEKILDVAKEYKSGEYVFPGSKGGRMANGYLYNNVSKFGRAVGIKLSPHRLRHSGITDSLNAGAQLFAVQKQAGHSQVTTTAEYGHTDLIAQSKAMEALGADKILDNDV